MHVLLVCQLMPVHVTDQEQDLVQDKLEQNLFLFGIITMAQASISADILQLC